MALPNNIITVTPVYAPFLEPLQSWVYNPLQEKVLGGTAIGNGQAGREVQNWIITYSAGVIDVSPQDGASQFSMSVAGVTSVSLGFDSNMAVAIAYQTAAGANFYYYNTLTAGYSTMTIAGATSCRSCVDDPRLFDSGASDVIFSYVLTSNLYYRVQRERYLTEHGVGPALNSILTKTGFTTAQRMQFELTPQ